MRNLNVTVGDSRDSEGKKRFFPFHPQNHIIPSMVSGINMKEMISDSYTSGSGRKDWAYEVYTEYAEV